MQQLHLQELVDLVVVMELVTTILKMEHLVETCILSLRRKTLLYPTALHVDYKRIGSAHATDILLKRVRHKPYTLGD